MHRVTRIALATIVLGSGVAGADSTQLGLFFGPRVFSDDSRLGYIEENPAHPSLDNGIEFGLRVARPFLPFLVPEIELGMAPTGTKEIRAMGGSTAPATDVFWLNPRLQLRFELLPGRRLQPFIVIGGGAPIALSSARKTFDTSILGDGYIGAGIRFDTGKRFGVRLDARVSMLPGIERYIAVEADFSVGIEIKIGEPRAKAKEQLPADMAKDVRDVLATGVGIVGSCCGSTPDHTKAIREVVNSFNQTK